jgi:polar amino acid transport system permease protein
MMHDFAIVWSERDLLLSGLANTVLLSLLAALAALVLGALLSVLLSRPKGWLALAAKVFVDAMRCTPFLLLAYLIYFGLPALGLRFDNWWAGAVALTVCHTAYMGELLRAAWAAQPPAMIEAGQAFGYTGLRLLRRIVLPPLVFSSAPVLGNQVVQIVKDSAFLTIIALPELTHAASSIQSRHYVPFAAFIAAVLLYWAICLVIEAGVSMIGRMADARR